MKELNKDALDVVIAMTGEGAKRYLAREWVERPMWVSAKASDLHKRTPAPSGSCPGAWCKSVALYAAPGG